MASAWVLVFTSAWCLAHFQNEAPPERRGALGATLFAGVGVGIAIAGAICAVLLTVARVIHHRHGLRWGSGIAGDGGDLGANRMGHGLCPASEGAAGAVGRGIRANDPSAMRRVRLRLHHPRHIPRHHGAEAAADPAIYGWSWPAFGAAAAASTHGAALLRRLDERT